MQKQSTSITTEKCDVPMEVVSPPLPALQNSIETPGIIEAARLPEFVWNGPTLLRLAKDNKYYPFALPERDEEFQEAHAEQIAKAEAEYRSSVRKIMLLTASLAGMYVIARVVYKVAEGVCVALATQFFPAFGSAVALAGEYLGYALVIVLGGYLLSFLLKSKDKPTLQDSVQETYAQQAPTAEQRSVQVNISLGDNTAQQIANNYRP